MVRACACASALASASETIRAASVTASGPASPLPADLARRSCSAWPRPRSRGAGRRARPRRAPAGGCGRAGGPSRRLRSAARGSGSSRASSRRRDGEVLREPVVDLGRQRPPLALHRRAQQLAPQPRGGDARGELQAEQAQDGPAQRVDPDRRWWRRRCTTPTISRSPVTSGRITQSLAGGVNGFSTSQRRGLAQHDRRRRTRSPAATPPGRRTAPRRRRCRRSGAGPAWPSASGR